MVQHIWLNYSLRVRFRVCPSPSSVKREDTVRGEEKRFAHVVLFECPWCLRLLSSAFLSFDEQLTDQPDDPMFNQSTTMCTCGWVGRALDIASASHSVQPWSRALSPSSIPEAPSSIPEAPSSLPEVPPTGGIAEMRDWLFLVAKQIGSLSGHKFENTPP